MNVLFVTRHLYKASEVWMQRRFRMLHEANALGGIAVMVNPERHTHWSGSVPVSTLLYDDSAARGIPFKLARLAARAAHRELHELYASRRLAQVIRQQRPDAILVSYGTVAAPLRSVLLNTNRRVVIHVHGFDTEAHFFPPAYGEQMRDLSRKALILCNSQHTRAKLLDWGISPERLLVKYTGIEVPPEPPPHRDGDEITILHLGRLIDCKAPDRTIHAFELACERGLNGRLIMAGDGNMMTTCQALANASRWRDRIELPGEVSAEQGAALRANADVFTLHSMRGEKSGQVEALGVAVLEAMAAALPVVSCRMGGILESVVDGETGILGEPDDVEAQAAAFLTLAHDPALRRQMGAAGWARARDVFSYEREKAVLLAVLSGERLSGGSAVLTT